MELKNQIFLQEGKVHTFHLEDDDEFIFPASVHGKVSVVNVSFGLDRIVHLRALEDVYIDEDEFVFSAERRAKLRQELEDNRHFEAYRSGLEEFLAYRSGLLNDHKDLRDS